MEYPTSSLKFMDDMARDVCLKMITSDQSKETPEERSLTPFMTNPFDLSDLEGLRANLRYLSLRFHGERIPDDAPDDPRLRALEDLFFAGSADPIDEFPPGLTGWATVCVGMLSAPEFHLY